MAVEAVKTGLTVHRIQCSKTSDEQGTREVRQKFDLPPIGLRHSMALKRPGYVLCLVCSIHIYAKLHQLGSLRSLVVVPADNSRPTS